MTRAKTIVQHDYGDPLTVTLRYHDTALDLTEDITVATPVVFIMTSRDDETGTPIINRAPATVVSATAKTVTLRYDWTPPQLDTPGRYVGQFEATLTGGAVTGPTLGHIPIIIEPDLG